MMSRNLVIGVVVVLVLVAAGWYLTRSKQSPSETPQATQTPPSTESASPQAASEGAMMKQVNMVKITASGFSLKDITIKVGDTVTWHNTDTENHNVNSAPHPTHTAYPLLNLGVIKPGGQKSLSFPTPGTYKYHDHLNPSLTGSVTVQ